MRTTWVVAEDDVMLSKVEIPVGTVRFKAVPPPNMRYRTVDAEPVKISETPETV